MMCTDIKKHLSRFQLFHKPGSNVRLPFIESLCSDAKPGSWMDPDQPTMDVLRKRWKFVEDRKRKLLGLIIDLRWHGSPPMDGMKSIIRQGRVCDAGLLPA